VWRILVRINSSQSSPLTGYISNPFRLSEDCFVVNGIDGRHQHVLFDEGDAYNALPAILLAVGVDLRYIERSDDN